MGVITERKAKQFSGLAADMASIPAGALTTGDLYFQTDTKAAYRWDGAAWRGPVPADWITATMLKTDSVTTIKIVDANVTQAKLAADAMGDFGHKLLHIQDQKASGTDGGTFTLGAWRTRDLNTVLTNEIPGSSLASDQITLPAGDYFILASAPAYFVALHKIKLRNITDGADAVIGSNALASGVDSQTHSFVSGRFTIGAEKVFELQHRSAGTKALDGFGAAATFAVIEVYADVLIWKV